MKVSPLGTGGRRYFVNGSCSAGLLCLVKTRGGEPTGPIPAWPERVRTGGGAGCDYRRRCRLGAILGDSSTAGRVGGGVAVPVKAVMLRGKMAGYQKYM